MALFLFISIPTLIMISIIIIVEINISYRKENWVILLDHSFGFDKNVIGIYRKYDHAYFIYDTKKNKFFIKNETWRVCNHNDYMNFLNEVRNLELEIAGDYWKWHYAKLKIEEDKKIAIENHLQRLKRENARRI